MKLVVEFACTFEPNQWLSAYLIPTYLPHKNVELGMNYTSTIAGFG